MKGAKSNQPRLGHITAENAKVRRGKTILKKLCAPPRTLRLIPWYQCCVVRFRSKIRFLLLGAITCAYILMWMGGVAHYIWYGKPPMGASWAASVFLLLAGLLVVVTSCGRDLAGLFLAATMGFIAELVGIHFGFIFSEYGYTDVLQPQVLGVPLVMLSSWMVLVAYTRQLLMKFDLPIWIEASIGAAWMAAIDLVIDPLAANQLGYWRWVKSSAYYGIPFHNFVGWFVVSLIIFLIVREQWQPNPWALGIGLSIILFFTTIAFSFGLIVVGGVGLVLCFTHYVMTTRGVPSAKTLLRSSLL